MASVFLGGRGGVDCKGDKFPLRSLRARSSSKACHYVPAILSHQGPVHDMKWVNSSVWASLVERGLIKEVKN